MRPKKRKVLTDPMRATGESKHHPVHGVVVVSVVVVDEGVVVVAKDVVGDGTIIPTGEVTIIMAEVEEIPVEVGVVMETVFP